MTDHDDQWNDTDEARLVRLMRSVPRGTPDPEARARAYAAVHEEWQRMRQMQVPAMRPRRRARWLAAASVAIAALAGLLWLASPGAPIATLDRANGRVSIAGAEGEAGEPIRRGVVLETGHTSGALVRYSKDLALRVDAQSRVELVDATTLRLDDGGVYVSITPGAAVDYVVRTARGEVRHVGTRYAVRAHDGTLDVAVRDGAVEIDAGAATERAVAGEQVSIAADGTIARVHVAADDALWTWTEALPAPIAIEGKSLAEFLRWYTAETGRTVIFADEGARLRAAAVILHGSVDGQPAAKALAVVMASVDLEATVPEKGPVVIGPTRR